FFIVAGAISLRAATLLGAVIVTLGVLAGLAAQNYQQWQSRRALEILTSFDFAPIGTAAAAEPEPFRVIPDGEHVIRIHRLPFAERSAPAGDKPFTRMEAHRLGIDRPLEFSFADMWPPFWEGRSISSGDFDNDGTADLVLASTEAGLYFYANDGSGRFSRVEFPIGLLAELPVFNAALVDIDNNGWLDLFVATYRAGNFILWNDGGVFDSAKMTEVKNRDDALLAMALAFGDVDGDGDLDLALGNWAAGWYRRIPGEEATNRLVFNEGGRLTGESYVDTPGPPGETLSLLLSDIDLDGDLDWLEGNDFEIPDLFFLGDGKGGLQPIRRQHGIIPITTTTTMAIKSADLHNDGVPEIYIAQIAGRSSGVSGLKLRSLDLYCSEIEREEERQACQANIDIKSWYRSGHSFDPSYASRCLEFSGRYQTECKAMLVKDLAIQNRDASVCGLIPTDQVRARQLCEIHFRPARQPSADELAESIPQILRRNVLLVRNEDGTYAERAVEQGLEVGGWSWDVKVADFDNDGWQDVYVVNGTWIPNEVAPSNLFYRNNGDGTFTEQSGPFELEDYLITAAAAQLDVDDDGDLDLVTVTVNGPVMVFLNNSQQGNAVAIAFRDHAANRYGIGNKVAIRHGGGGDRLQTRELQLGGGFMSFDTPVAHFGLGKDEAVDSVAIDWSNGGRTTIADGLPAGALYVIERQPVVTR
ncbi:MAG TPA: CRTAC1 family protein, partial [Afifellaceae bacterium]|nr:CRTAC1 family protein [Afifellaceae bacterium]